MLRCSFASPGRGRAPSPISWRRRQGRRPRRQTAAAAGESLKDALLKSLKTAAGAKQAQTSDPKTALAVTAFSHQHAAKAAEGAGHEEKNDGKKKITRLPVSTAANAALSASAIEAALLIAKLGDSGKKEESAAVQAVAVGSRTAVSQHNQPKILVVDLRKKAEANASQSAGAESKIQQTTTADKGPSLALLQRPSGHEAGGDATARQVPVSAPCMRRRWRGCARWQAPSCCGQARWC